jgi:hypothetical protein
MVLCLLERPRKALTDLDTVTYYFGLNGPATAGAYVTQYRSTKQKKRCKRKCHRGFSKYKESASCSRVLSGSGLSAEEPSPKNFHSACRSKNRKIVLQYVCRVWRIHNHF